MMPTQTYPIHSRANLSLFAAFLLIIGFGVVAVATHVQEPSSAATATEAVAEFGD